MIDIDEGFEGNNDLGDVSGKIKSTVVFLEGSQLERELEGIG